MGKISAVGPFGLRVQRKQCSTCIYRKDSPLDIKVLEAEIADPHKSGHFRSYRICHHSTNAVCRGFWNKHADHFDLGQVARRLDKVEFVDDDVFGPEK